jgi:hypothetical protein
VGGKADYSPTSSTEVKKIKHPQNIIALPFATGKIKIHLSLMLPSRT